MSQIQHGKRGSQVTNDEQYGYHDRAPVIKGKGYEIHGPYNGSDKRGITQTYRAYVKDTQGTWQILWQPGGQVVAYPPGQSYVEDNPNAPVCNTTEEFERVVKLYARIAGNP